MGEPAVRGRRRSLADHLGSLDAAVRRGTGAEANPLEWPGPLACLFLLVTAATGFALFAVYRVSADPYPAVAALDRHAVGRFLRTAHRYGADAALLFSTVHALREAAAGHYDRRWTVPWASGFLAVGFLLLLGVTGYVLPWDSVAQLALRTLTDALDGFPLLAAPPSRLLLPGNVKPWLFYLALAAHAMLSTVLTAVLAAHVLSARRRRLWARRVLAAASLAALAAAALLLPVRSQGPADLASLPPRVNLDLFYLFWIPVADRTGAGAALLRGVAAPLPALLPLLTGRRGYPAGRPRPPLPPEPDGPPAHTNRAGGRTRYTRKTGK